MPHLKAVVEVEQRVRWLMARMTKAEQETFAWDCPKVWVTYAPVINIRGFRWWKRWMPEPKSQRELNNFLGAWEREMCRRKMLG